METFGRVDILVNNAGVIVNKPFLEISEEEWEWQFDVITKGTYLCSQEIARGMARRADGGRIINISSSGGRRPLADESAYCAAKASVLMLTRVMALELAPYGITANAVCPGMIATEMLDKALREVALRRGVSEQEVKRGELLGVPLRRFGSPLDVAEACVYLASDAAAYVTGACIDITGGWMLP
jgi:NAD(P)-dependent dehydrogenase (short-subunit alcohol dehydrogenase family)